MDLYVVRHAIAFERDARRWPDDGDRPLTPAGRDRFRRAARGLRRVVPEVDLVLSSPLVRAWQTADILAEEAGWPAAKPCEALEPDRAPDDVIAALVPHASVAAVALVGHEPALGDLIGYLLTGPGNGPSVVMRKGGVARLDVDLLAPGRASLRWLLSPKIERAIRR